jgi:uncharacterized membrane protein YuzA (DUF378 family)
MKRSEKMLKKLNGLAVLLLVIGGIVWGFVGVYRLNLVTYVFDREWIIRVIYVIFGLSMIYHLLSCKHKSKKGPKR